MQPQEQGPQSLIQLVMSMVKGFFTGIPGMIKGMIVSAIITAVITNAIHLYLLGWVNDGWNPSSDPVLNAMIFVNGQQNDPKVMLFYFLLSYLFWWLIGTFRQKGISKTVNLIATTPIWIGSSLKNAGFGAFPMIVGGLAVSSLLGLFALTVPVALQMFIMMLTILISQQESLAIFAMQLGFKDVTGMLNRGQDRELPDKALPVMAVTGAMLGFGMMVFVTSNPMIIGALALLSVGGLVAMFLRNRGKNTAAMVSVIFIMIAIGSLMAPVVMADDGGIKENGGWGSLSKNAWLRNELIQRGYPASMAGMLAALIIQNKVSPNLMKQIMEGKLKRRPGETLQEMQTRQQIEKKMLQNLQHMRTEAMFGKATDLYKPGGPGDIVRNIDKTIDDLLSGKGMDVRKYDKIYRVYTKHIKGETIPESKLPKNQDWWIFKETLIGGTKGTVSEIITMRDSDGNFSKKALALRMLLSGFGGGAVEGAYTITDGMITFKENYDKTGSYWGSMYAVTTKLGTDELIGLGVGKGIEGVGWLGGKGIRGLYKTFPQAGKNVDEFFIGVKKTLNKDIEWPFGKKGLSGGGPQVKTPGQLYDDALLMRKGGQKYSGVDDFNFKKLDTDADLGGMTSKDRKIFENLCEEQGVEIHLRPTNPDAKKWIDSGMAHPKPMAIKTKTINKYDKYLGFSDDAAGLSACKKPIDLPSTKPPDVSDADWGEVIERHAKRSKEYADNADELMKMQSQGKIEWDQNTGIITDAKTGKPFAGDNDIYAWVDATTGKPVSPYTRNHLNKKAQQMGASKHGEHMDFDYSKYSGDKYDQMKNVDEGILNKHHVNNTGESAEDLNYFNPLERHSGQGSTGQQGWGSSRYDGPTSRTWVDPNQYKPKISQQTQLEYWRKYGGTQY